MKVVKKYYEFGRGARGEEEVVENTSLKTWRCTQILCYASTYNPSELDTYLKIGERRVYPYDGALNTDAGLAPFPADFRLPPHSTLKLYYNNASDSTQSVVLVLVFEEEE